MLSKVFLKIERRRCVSIKAVIFDMDGTLFDTEFIFQRIWNEIAGEMGLVLRILSNMKSAGRMVP